MKVSYFRKKKRVAIFSLSVKIILGEEHHDVCSGLVWTAALGMKTGLCCFLSRIFCSACFIVLFFDQWVDFESEAWSCAASLIRCLQAIKKKQKTCSWCWVARARCRNAKPLNLDIVWWQLVQQSAGCQEEKYDAKQIIYHTLIYTNYNCVLAGKFHLLLLQVIPVFFFLIWHFVILFALAIKQWSPTTGLRTSPGSWTFLYRKNKNFFFFPLRFSVRTVFYLNTLPSVTHRWQ